MREGAREKSKGEEQGVRVQRVWARKKRVGPRGAEGWQCIKCWTSKGQAITGVEISTSGALPHDTHKGGGSAHKPSRTVHLWRSQGLLVDSPRGLLVPSSMRSLSSKGLDLQAN